MFGQKTSQLQNQNIFNPKCGASKDHTKLLFYDGYESLKETKGLTNSSSSRPNQTNASNVKRNISPQKEEDLNTMLTKKKPFASK